MSSQFDAPTVSREIGNGLSQIISLIDQTKLTPEQRAIFEQNVEIVSQGITLLHETVNSLHRIEAVLFHAGNDVAGRLAKINCIKKEA